jgi:hypothetical protein
MLVQKLETGDFFATAGKGIAGYAVRNFIEPSSTRFHYGFIWLPLPKGDWITIESKAPKGLQLGLLSNYRGVDIEFYRANCDKHIRHAAPWETLDMFPFLYDYFLVAKMVGEGLWIVIKNIFSKAMLRRIYYTEFKYTADKIPICTEVIVIGYDCAGFHLINPGIAPTPNAMEASRQAGRFYKIG